MGARGTQSPWIAIPGTRDKETQSKCEEHISVDSDKIKGATYSWRYRAIIFVLTVLALGVEGRMQMHYYLPEV